LNYNKNILKYFTSRPALAWYWLLLLLAVIFVPHLFISYRLYQQAPMPDLYMRILGSRWMDIGFMPYFSQWQPGLPVSLYNPNSFFPSGVNGVTVTPAALKLQMPLARLSFCQIKTIWWLLSESVLFATFYITCKIPILLLRQIATIVFCTTFFVFSRNWWSHIYNGQYYIFFGFVYAITAYLILNRKKRFSALFIFPPISLIGPFFAVALIPWLFRLSRKRRLALAVSGVLALGLLVGTAPIKTWQEYAKAMTVYSNMSTTGSHYGNVDYRQAGLPLEDCITEQKTFKIFGGGNLFSVQHYLRLLHFQNSNSLLYPALLLLTCMLLVLITGQKNINANSENLLIFSFLLYIISELFTPADRNPYNMIQYLGILGVFIQKSNARLMALMLIGLLLNHDFPIRMPYLREIGEALMLIALYATIFQTKKKQL